MSRVSTRAGSVAGALADEELVRIAQDGGCEAFEELVRRHADRLYTVILRFCGDAGEAEEAVQETFLRAWRGIGGFEGRSEFFTWLYRIGLNEAKRRGSRKPPAEVASAADGLLDDIPDVRHAPEPEAERHEVRFALERAVRDLQPSNRAALILRDVEGLTTEQAAAIMGLREAAFKSRLHRARLAVRRSMREYVVKDA